MNQKEIKWLPLRLNIIPLIDKQAKFVLDLYLATRKQIIDGDILSIQKLTNIKQEIIARVKQIDAFYTKCAMDDRAKYLYAARSMLAKIAEQENQFEKINQYNINNDNNWSVAKTPAKGANNEGFGIASTTTQRKQVSQQSISQNNRALTSRTPFQHSQVNPYLTEAGKDSKVMRLSDLKKPSNKSKSPINIRDEQSRVLEKGTSRKIQQGVNKKGVNKKIEEVIQLQKEKNQMNSRLQRSPYDINKSFKDLSELVFTIKMTKQEYNEFMRLKRKNNHA